MFCCMAGVHCKVMRQEEFKLACGLRMGDLATIEYLIVALRVTFGLNHRHVTMNQPVRAPVRFN